MIADWTKDAGLGPPKHHRTDAPTAISHAIGHFTDLVPRIFHSWISISFYFIQLYNKGQMEDFYSKNPTVLRGWYNIRTWFMGNFPLMDDVRIYLVKH